MEWLGDNPWLGWLGIGLALAAIEAATVDFVFVMLAGGALAASLAVAPVMGAANLPRGARVRVKLGEMDLITLDIHGTVVERLDVPVAGDTSAPDDDAAEDEDEVAGPIAIAVDVSESPDAAATTSDNPAP